MPIKLTRQRTILAGLLLAAGAALLVDQFTADASVAEGADDLAVASPAGRKSSTGKPAAAPLTPERALAERLQQLAGPPPADVDAVRDIFATGPASSARIAGGPSAADPDGWARHVLNGVMMKTDRTGVAIVDGKAVSVGGQLDGMTLVRLTSRMAVFSDGKHQVVLRLPEK